MKKKKKKQEHGEIDTYYTMTLHSVLLWEPLHSQAQRGQPHLTYVDTLRADTRLHSLQEIARIMDDRDCWTDLVHGSREYYRTWLTDYTIKNSMVLMKMWELWTQLILNYISQLVHTLWLVNFASRILLFWPLNLKVSFPVHPINLRDIINILLTSFSRSVL